MRETWLITAALVVPLAWGYLVHRVMLRIWPERIATANSEGRGADKAPPPKNPLDYQI
jgi:hypothetical protein